MSSTAASPVFADRLGRVSSNLNQSRSRSSRNVFACEVAGSCAAGHELRDSGISRPESLRSFDETQGLFKELFHCDRPRSFSMFCSAVQHSSSASSNCVVGCPDDGHTTDGPDSNSPFVSSFRPPQGWRQSQRRHERLQLRQSHAGCANSLWSSLAKQFSLARQPRPSPVSPTLPDRQYREPTPQPPIDLGNQLGRRC